MEKGAKCQEKEVRKKGGPRRCFFPGKFLEPYPLDLRDTILLNVEMHSC